MGSRGPIARPQFIEPHVSATRRPAGIPKVPAGYGKAQKACWVLCWEQQSSHEPDVLTIEHLCRREGEAERLGDQLAKEGMTFWRPIITPKGEVVGREQLPHPNIKALRDLDKVVISLRGQLGLSPESRVRLGLDLIARSEEPTQLDLLVAKRRVRRAGEPTAEIDRQYAQFEAAG
jgi:hypothetical protein